MLILRRRRISLGDFIAFPVVGDMVSHMKFGEGKVLAIEDSARDYMVTVEFAEYGQKKMLAGFARLKKL